ncbi:MAG: asparagine synthase-related protein [candidate division Zixibacteria bacterium]|nr:asparagine synthase-related protein [candidate division Zixibacteria bacterium]
MKFIGSVTKPLQTIVNSAILKKYNTHNENFAIEDGFELSEKDGIKIFTIGSIYNLNKLKPSFKDVSTIDELIREIYKKQGVEGFKVLDGEYTIIIQDNGKTLLYRDRHGAGEQVYYTDDYFSSHQNLLLSFTGFSAEPNFNNLALFLNLGYIPSPGTGLMGVNKLAGGQALTFEDGKSTCVDIYSFEDYYSPEKFLKISEQEATEEYERLHKSAIKDRVGSSDAVQLLLSGGYDSGGNISALRDVYSGNASSYSIGFKNNSWSELPLAKILSETFNTKHFEYEIDGSEIEDLPEIVRHMGDPFNENGVLLNYSVMKLVSNKEGKGIILGGDGNDQHFGSAGKELALNHTYRSNGIAILQKIVNGFAGMSIFDKDSILFKIRFHNEKVLNILKSDSFGLRKSQISKLFKEETDISHPEYLKNLPDDIKGFDQLFMIHNYFSDIKQVINEVILFKASKLAGQFDKQLSYPYMSTDLYNFLMRLPRNLKLKGSLSDCASGAGKSKFLHKNYLYPKLPKEITERKKQGGFAPLPIFLQNTEQFNKVANIILNSSIAKNHFNFTSLITLLNNYRDGKDGQEYWFWYKQVRAFQILNLLTLVIWWDIMIEGKEINTLSEM